MKTHTGEKSHECKDWGKKFSQSSVLATDEKTHTGEKINEFNDLKPCSSDHKVCALAHCAMASQIAYTLFEHSI